jgi:predicted O-methyltransferase YrrM
VHPEIRAYLDTLVDTEDPILDVMETYASERNFPLVGRESGRWLELLARMIGARRVFEMGSGWGYSAFFFARAVGEGGEVHGSEKDSWELEAHRKLMSGHPLSSRIHLHQGDAFDVLDAMEGCFDVVFIDVDKQAYPEALERAVERLRVGGLVLVDNALWGGKVARAAAGDDPSTLALQQFNQRLVVDSRLGAGLLPIGDGLGVGLKLTEE